MVWDKPLELYDAFFLWALPVFFFFFLKRIVFFTKPCRSGDVAACAILSLIPDGAGRGGESTALQARMLRVGFPMMLE